MVTEMAKEENKYFIDKLKMAGAVGSIALPPGTPGSRRSPEVRPETPQTSAGLIPVRASELPSPRGRTEYFPPGEETQLQSQNRPCLKPHLFPECSLSAESLLRTPPFTQETLLYSI
ncbi:WASH complex subunit 2A [Manis javanica]|nr:WASH complex subunit 2A [Manis javanica]